MRIYRLFQYYFKTDLCREPRLKCQPAFAVVAPNRAIAELIFYRRYIQPLQHQPSEFREFTVTLKEHPLRQFTPFFSQEKNQNRIFNMEFIRFSGHVSLMKTSNHSYTDAFHQFRTEFPEQKIPLKVYVVFDDVLAVLLGSGVTHLSQRGITYIPNNVIKFKSFLIRKEANQHDS